MLRLLTAPPASGKTRYCIEQLYKARENHPRADLWALVADVYQAQDFTRRMAAPGGLLGVRVVTFNRLLGEILDSTGNSVPIAPPALRQLLIRQAIDELHEQGEIEYFRQIREKPGLVRVFQRRFEELKRALVYPEIFLDYVNSENAAPALSELAAVYARYQHRLQNLGWADPEGKNWLAVEFLKDNPDWNPGWPLLIFDGFDSFTRPQMAALGLLAKRLPQVILTQTGEHARSRPIHRQAENTRRQLEELVAIQDIPLEGALGDLAGGLYLPAPLGHLEAHFGGDGGAGEASRLPALTMIPARSPAEEAREALRWLKSLHVRQGVPLEACAVVVTEASLYIPHLKTVALEFGLPLHFAVGTRLAETPLFAALEQLLALTVHDFPRRPTLDTLRSPYFDLSGFGLAPADAGLLDALSRAHQVVSGAAVWLESLDSLSRAPEAGPERLTEEEQAEEDETGTAPRLPDPRQAGQLRTGLGAFFTRLAIPGEGSPLPLAGWVGWLEDLLEDVRFAGLAREDEGPAAEAAAALKTDAAALERLRQVLRELLLAELTAGERPLAYADFISMLQDAAAGAEIKETAWRASSAIQVLRTAEGRGVRREAVAVLGLSEGILPHPQRADPFLDEDARGDLGMESALDAYQSGVFYKLLTRADNHLLLTRPYLAADGAPWEASPYWQAVADLVREAPQPVRPESRRDVAEAGSPQEALGWAVRARAIHPAVRKDLEGQAGRVLHGRGVLEARQGIAPEQIYNGDLAGAAELVRERYGPEAVWSPSRLESYKTCPHLFFTASLLNLEAQEEPEAGFDAAQLGSLLHRILERVFAEAADPSDLAALLERLDAVAAEEFPRAPLVEGFRPTPLWELEQAELKEKLAKTIQELHAVSDGWTPLRFEAKFGIGGAPPLALDLGERRIFLRGVIDRVDRGPGGAIRVIDYKTGSSHLDKRSLEEGRRLQLPLYALAARDALGLGEPVEGFYWAIQAAKAGSLKLGSYGLEDAYAVALEHVRAVVAGADAAAFEPAPPAGGCPSYCPAAAWCWAYEPRPSWGSR